MKHPKFHNVVFSVCLSVSVALIVAGFIVPPTGVIDPSVLTAVGELFAFAALSQLPFVIASGKGLTLNHGNTSISVNRGSTGAPPVNREEGAPPLNRETGASPVNRGDTGAPPVPNDPDDDQDPC